MAFRLWLLSTGFHPDTAWARRGRRRPGMDCFAAADLLREAIVDCFGSVEADVAAGLKLRHDRGSCFRSAHY